MGASFLHSSIISFIYSDLNSQRVLFIFFFFYFSVIFYANYFQVFTSTCFSQPPSFDFLNHDCRTQFSFNCFQDNFLILRINVPTTFIFKRDPSSREHLTRFDGRPSIVSFCTIDPITGLCLHCHLCCTFVYNSLTFTCRTNNCLLSDHHSIWLGTQ